MSLSNEETVMDRVPWSQLDKIKIPQVAKEFLHDPGVPAELRLPGWEGPTLFTSEIGREPPSAIDGAFVFGSIRDSDQPDLAYAVFGVSNNGEVVISDIDRRERDGRTRFANSSLSSFVSCLAMLVDSWPRLECGDIDASSLRERIEEIDPHALADVDSYWSSWLAELTD